MDSVKMKTMGYRRVASVLIRADRVLACYLPLFTSGAVLSQKHLSIVWKCTELRFTRGVLSFRGDISGVISRRDSRIPENGSVKNGKNWILRIPFFFFFFPQPSCARYGKKKKKKMYPYIVHLLRRNEQFYWEMNGEVEICVRYR